jgi:hypothetical protein
LNIKFGVIHKKVGHSECGMKKKEFSKSKEKVRASAGSSSELEV